MYELDGLKQKNHVMELSRLMIRAESLDHRLSLLAAIQVLLHVLQKTNSACSALMAQ